MAKTQRLDKIPTAASPNFEKLLERYKGNFKSIRELKNLPDDRLRKEIFFIWRMGKNSLADPDWETDLLATLRLLFAAREGLSALNNQLGKLGPPYQKTFVAAFKAHPSYKADYDRWFSIEDLVTRLTTWVNDLDAAHEVFDVLLGVDTHETCDLKPKHKAATDDLMPIVNQAMRSWQLITGKDVKYAKGVDLEGDRPQEDDAYFVFLCLRMTVGDLKPGTAIAAINRARKWRKEFAAYLEGNSARAKRLAEIRAFFDARDIEMRRKLYGLEY